MKFLLQTKKARNGITLKGIVNKTKLHREKELFLILQTKSNGNG